MENNKNIKIQAHTAIIQVDKNFLREKNEWVQIPSRAYYLPGW